MKCFIIATFIMATHGIFAQCAGFPATVNEPTCAGGVPLTSGANINSGSELTFCGANSNAVSFTGLNLNGGQITICGNANLSGNWNSGTIVVACGATANFPNGLLLNNGVKVVNYGTVNVTGTLEMQNVNNCFYNQRNNSRLFVTQQFRTAQNAGQNGYLINNGYISIGTTFQALDGGFYCLGSNSAIECQTLDYGVNCGNSPSNRFTFNDTGAGNAVIRYTTSASIKGTVTASNRIRINQGNGSSVNFHGCGSWGGATAAVNAPAISVPSPGSCSTPNCFSVLPVVVSEFTAQLLEDRTVLIAWTTQHEWNNAYFTIERSTDLLQWETIHQQESTAEEGKGATYAFIDLFAQPQTTYYRLKQVDIDGTAQLFSPLSVFNAPDRLSVHTDPASGKLHALFAALNDTRQLQLYTMQGVLVAEETVEAGAENAIVAVSGLRSGIYTVRLVSDNSQLTTKCLLP